jgi:hypothetical protein
MPPPRKAVNGYKEILIELLETSSTNPIFREGFVSIHELPIRVVFSETQCIKRAGV